MSGMKATEFAELIIRILAVYFICRGIFHTLYTGLPLFALDPDFTGIQMGMQLSGLISYAFVSAILWFGAKRISHRIASNFRGDVTTDINLDQSLSLLFIGAGLYLFSLAIPTIIDTLRMLISEPYRALTPNYDYTGKLVLLAVYLGLAGYFILGAQGLKTLILKLRGK